MSELAELIRINRNIESQNREIIRLLKIIAGEADFVDRSGYVMPEFEEPEEIYSEMESFESLLDVTCDIGEAYFIDGDIFKLTIQNNEVVIDNLMGGDETVNFNVAEIASRESIERNQNIDDATVILTDSSKGKLPQTLEMCYNQDAKKVYIPFDQAMELLGAPDTLQKVLKLNFYKSEEDLIDKLFGQ